MQRAEGRRRLVILLSIGGVLCFLGLAWAVVHSAFLDVDRVRVTTPGAHTSTAAIVRAAGIKPGAAMVFLDTDAAAARVRRLPWVATASVTQHYPGDVEIRVTERNPIAFLAGVGGVDVLDRTGRVLGTVPTAPAGTIELTGVVPVAAGARIDAPELASMIDDLPMIFRARVAKVTLAGEDVTVTLVDGREVRFGVIAQAAAKAAAAEAVLESVGDRPIHYVDVRVPTAPATG